MLAYTRISRQQGKPGMCLKSEARCHRRRCVVKILSEKRMGTVVVSADGKWRTVSCPSATSLARVGQSRGGMPRRGRFTPMMTPDPITCSTQDSNADAVLETMTKGAVSPPAGCRERRDDRADFHRRCRQGAIVGTVDGERCPSGHDHGPVAPPAAKTPCIRPGLASWPGQAKGRTGCACLLSGDVRPGSLGHTDIIPPGCVLWTGL